MLWESVLQQLAAAGDDPELLRPHAAALMRSAARATQSLLTLSRSAMTEEETLLATALRAVRGLCADRGLLSLNLAPPEELGFLARCIPPAIAGQPRLTPLQQRLQELYWSDASLLLEPEPGRAAPSLLATAHLEAEIAACARWCRQMLQRDGAQRLLVISTWSDPGAHTQGALLWREFAGDSAAVSDEQRRMLLAVEGGEPLHHQALVADALVALAALDEWIDTQALLRLLRSPYFDFGSAAECSALQTTLGSWGLARWSALALDEALASQATRQPAAARLQGWLNDARRLLRESSQRMATGWAESYSQCLHLAGFAASAALESRDAQRLARWGELLDEFAGLDAVTTPLNAAAALAALRQLALQSTHQSATGDAAITLSTQLHDPVVRYDGIWVLGLTENRWPEPPRPDPYIALSEQRRCHWPEAGVTQRLQAARWLLGRWQASTDQLTLSFALQEGDVRHRPSAAVPVAAEAWQTPLPAPADPLQSVATAAHDPGLPPIAASDRTRPLRGGLERLRVQQECAFRAQAQWRLGAEQPAVLTDGIPTRLRGMLLHSLLEGLWQELRDQQNLLQLTPSAQAALIEQHWQNAVRGNAVTGAAWLTPQVLQRERLRATRLMERVLELDRQRAPFTVLECEREIVWNAGDASLRLRIDRIDRSADELLLIDYKSGSAESIGLQEGELRPLQLAAYVAALADAGMPVTATALLSLKPADLKYAGAASDKRILPGRIQEVTDWPVAEAQWRAALARLLQEHIAGGIELAASLEACRYCHLPALCRRIAAGEAAATAENADE